MRAIKRITLPVLLAAISAACTQPAPVTKQPHAGVEESSVAGAWFEIDVASLENTDTAAVRRELAERRAALAATDRASEPVMWAIHQARIGALALRLGFGGDVSLLRESANASRAAFSALSEARFRAVRAELLVNIASADTLRGAGRDEAALRSAIDAARDAIALSAGSPRSHVWGVAQSQLGAALISLSQMRGDPAMLAEAIAALETATGSISRTAQPRAWARAQANLAAANLVRGDATGEAEPLRRAVASLRAALAATGADSPAEERAQLHANLSLALSRLATLEPGAASFAAAEESSRAALRLVSRASAPMVWGRAQFSLGFAKEGQSAGTDRLLLAEAARAYEAAIDAFRGAGATFLIDLASERLAEVRARLAGGTA